MWKKLFLNRIWNRIYIERLGEPLIYNLVSIFIFIFGSFVKKIDYDLVPRQPYAFGLNEAFKIAKLEEKKKILILEFGVASGAGLYNLSYISKKLSKIYKIDYEIIGFDTGKGMPPPIDYRDHPEKYRTADFPSLKLNYKKLPQKTKVYLGNIVKTLKCLKNDLKKNVSINFISIDVDYYSSTLAALKVLNFNKNAYCSKTVMYFDDTSDVDHNEYCGELLAINEFNKKNKYRKIFKINMLRNCRIFKNASWLDQMFFMHSFDSDYRKPKNWKNKKKQIITNPYI